MLSKLELESAGLQSVRETEISLLELVGTLARRKFLILGAALAAMIVAVPIALLIPPEYAAEAVILPPQLESYSPLNSAASALAGVGGAGALGGVAAATGFWRNPADLYVGMLKSRSIVDALVERFQLATAYDRRTLADTRKELARRTSVTSGRDLLIRIKIEDWERQRAAALANAYVEELLNLTSRLALTAASRRRVFLQQELTTEKDLLAAAEVAMKNAQQSSGLVAPSGQSEALIRASAQLQAEVASREVQLEAMRSYATAENPQVLVLEREVKALRSQLEKLKSGGGETDNLVLPSGILPEASLEYVRKLRNLRYHETLFELLSKQFEAARIDEARAAPLVQVIDRATPPDKRDWPPRMLIVLVSGLAAALAAGFFVLIRGARAAAT